MNKQTTMLEVMEETPEEFEIIISENNVDKPSISGLLDVFQPFLNSVKKWQIESESISVTDVNQKKEMAEARRIRLELKNARVSIEKKRKLLKENLIRDGRIIDGFANVCKKIIEPLELRMQENEEFEERLESKRKLELRLSRESALKVYGIDTNGYNLENMPVHSFEQLLANSKLAFEKQEEMRKKEEEERLLKIKAEEEEKKRIFIENQRLMAEAKERELAAAKERQEIEKKNRLERAELEKKAAAERYALEQKLKKEAEEKRKLELELIKKKKDEEVRKNFLDQTSKPDIKESIYSSCKTEKEKLKHLSVLISELKFPEMTSTKGKEVINLIKSQNEKYVKFVLSQSEKI